MINEELGAVDYLRVTPEGVAQVRGGVIGETKWTLFVNRRELVSFMCTPSKLHLLALGFMRSENIIGSLDDVLQIRVYESVTRSYWYQPALGLNGSLTMRTCEESVGVIDARVRGDPAPRLGARILTSGCTGGVTFDDLSHSQPRLESSYRIALSCIWCRGSATSSIWRGRSAISIRCAIRSPIWRSTAAPSSR